MKKKTTTAAIAGLFISLVIIVQSMIFYFTGLFLNTWAGYVGFAILAIGVIWAVLNNAKELNNDVKYGQLFAFGFKVACATACIIIVYSILAGFIFPDIKVKVMEVARQKALEKPGVNADQIEVGMKFFEKNFTLFMVIGIIFWYLVIGLISALIAAAIPKKNPQSSLDNQFK